MAEKCIIRDKNRGKTVDTVSEKTLGKIRDVLKNSKLFNGCGAAADEAARNGSVLVLKKGEILDVTGGKLFVVLSGVLLVSSNNVTLNLLEKGSVTGVTGLFGGKTAELRTSAAGNPDVGFSGFFGGKTAELRTLVKAFKPSKVFVLCEQDVKRLIADDGCFADSYIRFLTDRIRFLNRRMAYFTAESVRKRLAGYLLDATSDENPAVTVNMSKLSGFLNVGRASLYRTLDALAAEGAVRKEGRGIVVLSREKLAEG
jgi:CRP-like cAMP-binding protein